MADNQANVVSGQSLWRQMGFFTPNWLGDNNIYIVGAGATGSHVADTLASMGISNIEVFDFDKVEEHNLPNQIYELEDIGTLKVDALARHIKRKMGYDINVHNEKVEKIDNLKGYLVLCTDSMATQKQILLSSGARNPNCLGVIETRMGIDQGRVYFLDPNLKGHLKRWGDKWYSDEEAGESPCNMRAIAMTAKMIASIAAGRIVLDLRRQNDPDHFADTAIFNETIIHCNGKSVNSVWE
jgi:hypothetical protein